jgi:hypothetical protein
MKKILICQLGVNGDCLYATTIARQIKQDNPGCRLDWRIGSKYKDILDNNPDVDNVMEYPIGDRLDVKKEWFNFVKFVNEHLKELYDEIYFTQAYPGNPDLFYDSLRASMFRVYPHPITVPLNPVVVLSQMEVERVAAFANHHHLSDYKHVVLFECSPQSGQSPLTEEGAIKIATSIATQPSAYVIMSGNSLKMSNLIRQEGCKNIIDASCLTFRENAELTKYCTLLVGTGSGITQICQSTWAKHLPTIQILDPHTVASLISDHEYFGLPTDDIIEITETKPERISSLISATFFFGIKRVKESSDAYSPKIEPDFNIIRFHMRFDTAMITGRPLDIIPALFLTVKEYGFSTGLLYFISTLPGSVKTILKRKSEGVY